MVVIMVKDEWSLGIFNFKFKIAVQKTDFVSYGIKHKRYYKYLQDTLHIIHFYFETIPTINIHDIIL